MLEKSTCKRINELLDTKNTIDEYISNHEAVLHDIGQRELDGTLDDKEQELADTIRNFRVGYKELETVLRKNPSGGYDLRDRQIKVLQTTMNNGDKAIELIHTLEQGK